ncbi:hypothetical protein EYC84_003635 [Monilinia fructicola]|uniref:PLD phosphodiesterase domain-containing protein n=1 Tax=Monilinia fructicola TaxID=38448 RepID=A0A5M9JXA6_MONFR|nr:hypothetical protein EYC84_003635 [Monilinia fructicola]
MKTMMMMTLMTTLMHLSRRIFKLSQAQHVPDTSTGIKVGPSSQVSSQQSATILNSLNRKQMEEQRIARAQLRSKASNMNATGTSLWVKKPTENGADNALDKAARRPANPESHTDIGTSGTYAKLPIDVKPGGDVSGAGIQFPHGVVKKTWADGFPREDDIKIEEVLQHSTLQHAVLSAFQVEPDWVISKLLRTTKVIWVLQAKTEAEKLNYQSSAPETFRFCFPSMKGNVNIMHSKLQLLAHETHLRLVIPSANLTPYDWGESGGIMENVVFLIDLPRLPNGERASDDQLTPFAMELLYFLRAMELPPKTLESLRSFDYSKTYHLAFVHSIGGSHSGMELQRTGYPGLGRSVSSLGLNTDQPLEVDFVTASVGSLDDRFLRTIYLASQGDNGYKEYNSACIFPAKKTVLESKGGTDAAGTICFRSKWYDASGFPRNIMRDCQSRRKGLLMHNKMLFVRSRKAQQSTCPIAWAYIGSANLSESAWGRMVKDRVTKEPKLNCRNWECGVLFSVSFTVLNTPAVTKSEIPTMDAFDGSIPVPMVFPANVYGSKSPWWGPWMSLPPLQPTAFDGVMGGKSWFQMRYATCCWVLKIHRYNSFMISTQPSIQICKLLTWRQCGESPSQHLATLRTMEKFMVAIMPNP